MNYMLQKKCRQFSESAIEASEKLEEVKPEVAELAEESKSEKIENFSIMNVKTKVRRIKKLFSETADSIDDATVNAEEVLKEAEKTDDPSVINRAKVNFKAFSELQKEFKKLNEDAIRTAEISANKGETNVPASISPSKVDPVVMDTAKPSEGLSVTESENSSKNNLKKASELNVATSLNFSSLYRGKCNALVRQFNKVMECFSTAVDTAEILGDCMTKYNESIENDIEDDNKDMNDDKKLELETELNKVPEGVSATAIELANFTQEMAEKIMDIADKEDIDKEKFDKVQASFTEMARCFDAVSKDKSDENIDATINAVEDCKEKIQEFAKECKFSVRRKFSDVIKTFSEVDGIMDNFCGGNDSDEVSVDDVVEFFSERLDAGRVTRSQARRYGKLFSEMADKCSDAADDEDDDEIAEFAEKSNEIDDTVDNLELVEDKVEDDSVKQFSFIAREAIKRMRCFSEEDVDAKLQFAEAVAETLQKEVERQEHPAECDCEECKAKEKEAQAEAEQNQAEAAAQQQDGATNEEQTEDAEDNQDGEAKEFSEDGDKPSDKVAEADERINDSLDDLKHLEDKIEDEKVKNFARRLRTALRNTVCFSEEEVESKLKDTEDLTKDVSDELAKQKEAKDEKESKEVHIRMDDKKSDAAPAEEGKDTKTAETKVTFCDDKKDAEEVEPKAKSETEEKVDKVISNFSTVNVPEGSYGSYIMGITGIY